ncbi:hypothetical protein ACLOJK_008545 [Asimina triloba]
MTDYLPLSGSPSRNPSVDEVPAIWSPLSLFSLSFDPSRLPADCLNYLPHVHLCTFFRWLDEKGQSRSGVESESRVQYESSAHKHGDIVVDFRELVCCVDVLKNSHLKEATKWKQSRMTMKKDICGLVN